MRWLDPTIPQNTERVRGDDRCVETSTRNDENGRRSKHYYYRDRGKNPQS